MQLPQEIEVWYVIPAIRKDLARELSENHDLSQREIAKLLEVTEAAVSQYKREKRGKLKLPEDARSEIKKSAGRIANSSSTVFSETQRLLKHMRGTLTICDIHRLMDEKVPGNCRECGGYL